MFSIENHTNMNIVFKNDPILSNLKSNETYTSKESVVNESTMSDESIDYNIKVELEQSKLPWQDANWSIEITLVDSTVDVWGRIVDSDDWVSLY